MICVTFSFAFYSFVVARIRAEENQERKEEAALAVTRTFLVLCDATADPGANLAQITRKNRPAPISKLLFLPELPAAPLSGMLKTLPSQKKKFGLEILWLDFLSLLYSIMYCIKQLQMSSEVSKKKKSEHLHSLLQDNSPE